MLRLRDHGVADYQALPATDATNVGVLSSADRACLAESGEYLAATEAWQRFADPAQSAVGMPGSRLGTAPNGFGPSGPLPGVRTAGDATAGVNVGATGISDSLEDPSGQPAPAPQQGMKQSFLPPALGP